MSLSPSNIVASAAVGYQATTPTFFNDVQDGIFRLSNVTRDSSLTLSSTVGLWPAHLYIKHVDQITLYYSTNPNTVNGIQIVYTLTNQTQPVTVMHGSTAGTSVVLKAREGQFFVGFFGLQDSGSQPVLRSIGFLVYDSTTGLVTPSGQFLRRVQIHVFTSFQALSPPAAQNPNPAQTGFGSLVRYLFTVQYILALNPRPKDNLETLSIYKFQSGTGYSGL
ncbi:hypothetical protein H0H92_005957 [Tricholoma furcatifolium]|nr:hypothetical protein H0H92_005957 [Tricholoma furcatifolium]